MFAQPRIVSVSQVTDYLRLLVERDQFLANIWVEGEVSNVYQSRAGHIYFTLSDGESSIKAVAFRAVAIRVQRVVENGAHVVVGGRVSIYSKDGTAQIYVEFADSSGQGVQALELARLRAQLETEGLFDPARKRILPDFPSRIAVVTSPTGAVIHDIQTVLRRRFPLATLLVSPAQVQGAGAVDRILEALDLVLERADADLVIIARGGGSAEDLSAFNDERLARAVFAYPLPVISAIGHETDVSILDEVADLRAPTPTAAAELATPDIADLALEVLDVRDYLQRSLRQRIAVSRMDLDHAIQRLDRSSPAAVLARHRERLDLDRSRLRIGVLGLIRTGQQEGRVHRVRLSAAGIRVIHRQREDVNQANRQVQALVAEMVAGRKTALSVDRARLVEMNPTSLLKRGYSVLTRPDGTVIESITAVNTGTPIRAVVRDGTITADVTSVSARNG